MPNKRNLQVKCTPEFKKFLWDTTLLAGFKTMSAFVRHAILREGSRALHNLSLNSEITSLINLARKLEKEGKNREPSN